MPIWTRLQQNRMEEQEESEVLFEDWLYKLSGQQDNGRVLRWSNSWLKRYFILQRVGEKAELLYYRSKPTTINQQPRGKIELTSGYEIYKQNAVRGKACVCQLTTHTHSLVVGTDNHMFFQLFVFLLQTQTQLKSELADTDGCFVVRPENSEDHQKIGSRGNMCLLYVSPVGIILSLELSKCVLGLWPLACIKTYESSGRGQFAINAGRRSPLGEGRYVFNTRIGQDVTMYNMLDHYVNNALNQPLKNESDLSRLHPYLVVHTDPRFTLHLRRITRNIYDQLNQRLGGESQRLKASTTDLLEDSPRSQHNLRSGGVVSNQPPRPVAEKPTSQHFRSPPPTYHQYGNDIIAERQPVVKAPVRPIEMDYLQTRPPSQTTNSPTDPVPKGKLMVDMSPKSMTSQDECFPLVGVTATLPSQERSAFLRSLSRSAEDLSEHMRRSVRQNEYVYNNKTFQLGEESPYSYATVPRNMGGAGAIPKNSNRNIRRQHPPGHGYSMLDKNMLRKSLSNPALLDAPKPGPRPGAISRPQRPMQLKLLTKHSMGPATSASPLSASSTPISSPHTSSTPLSTPQTGTPQSSITSPLSLAGINVTPQTRSFTKKKLMSDSAMHPLAVASLTGSEGTSDTQTQNNRSQGETLC